MKTLLSTCQDEEFINNLFGSVSEFARLVEENGNTFTYRGILIEYNEDEDIHYFYSVK